MQVFLFHNVESALVLWEAFTWNTCDWGCGSYFGNTNRVRFRVGTNELCRELRYWKGQNGRREVEEKIPQLTNY